jgi:hypothetical protein
MKPTRNFIPSDSTYPFRGIDLLDPSSMMDPRLSPSATNVMFTDGIVAKRLGYTRLGTAVEGLTSPVMALVEWENLSGTKKFVALTTTKQYVFGGSSWTSITPVDTNSAEIDLTGDEDDPIEYAVVEGDEGRFLIMTNGVDAPRFWDGSGTAMTVLGSASATFSINYPNFFTCKTLGMFYNHLVMANVTTGTVGNTTDHPRRVIWSDIGSLNEWVTGTSGEAEIIDSDGSLQKLLPLGDRMVLYSEDSIGVISYIGGDVIYGFEQVIRDTRLTGPRAIVNIGPFHLFASQQDIYLFDGTKMARPMGMAVRNEYREVLDVEHRNRCSAFLDAPKRHVYWIIPTYTDPIVYVLEYDVFDPQNFKWSRLSYNDRPVSFGYASRNTTDLWNSETNMAWLDDAGFWKMGETRKDYPVRVMGSDGTFWFCDEASYTDNSVAVESTWESIDFSLPQIYQSVDARFQEIELELQGGSVDVYYSTDQGSSWTSAGTLTLTSAWARHKAYIDTVGKTFRVRLVSTETTSSFKMRWLRVWFIPGSPNG